jgi:hypothetical protein
MRFACRLESIDRFHTYVLLDMVYDWSSNESSLENASTALHQLFVIWYMFDLLLKILNTIFRYRHTTPPSDHLLLPSIMLNHDSALNHGPLISRWENNKFENCWYKTVRILEALRLLVQWFLNLSSSQRDLSGSLLGDLSNNRWSGVPYYVWSDGALDYRNECACFIFARCVTGSKPVSFSSCETVVNPETWIGEKNNTSLNELYDRRPLVALISQMIEELKLFNLV